jgi:transposase
MAVSFRARKAGRCGTCGGCKNSNSIIPLIRSVLQEMVEAVRLSKERVERLEQTIEEFVPNWSLAPVVRALQALRGIDLIVSVTFVTEIGDVRRFESPRQLMGYLGLVPSERSTGATVRRGGITKAGNGRVRHMLVESAWTYRHLPRIGTKKLYLLLSAVSSHWTDRVD